MEPENTQPNQFPSETRNHMQSKHILLMVLGSLGILTVGIIIGSTINSRSNMKQATPASSPTKNNISLAPTQSEMAEVQDIIRRQDIDFMTVYLKQYFADKALYPMDIGQLSPTYMTTIPTDPVTKKSYTYLPSPNRESFTLTAILSTGEKYEGNLLEQHSLAKTVMQVEISQIRNALELYRFDNTVYPEKLSSLIPTYIKSIKKHPFTGKEYLYQKVDNSYTLSAEFPDGEKYIQTAP